MNRTKILTRDAQGTILADEPGRPGREPRAGSIFTDR